MNKAVAGLIFAAGVLPAQYLNLIATADGETVFFEARTSAATTGWFSVHSTNGVLSSEALDGQLADVDDNGDTRGFASYVPRQCGVAGSTCFQQPPCQASYSLKGAGVDRVGTGRRTFLRFNSAGSLAWIEQNESCPGFAVTLPPPLNGLYEAATMRQIARSDAATAASRRTGRRMITDTGRVLTIRNGQLHWVDQSGSFPIRHINGVFEAVTDATGDSIVYVEDEVGELHWITGGIDFKLGLQGSAPALVPDGSAMFYLDRSGALIRYDGVTNVARRFSGGLYRAFTLAGENVFAISTDNRIVHISGNRRIVTWQSAFPRIDGFDAPVYPFLSICPRYCYYERGFSGIFLEAGKRVRVSGRYLRQRGLRVTSPYMDVSLEPESDTSASFEVPQSIPPVPHTIEIHSPVHPVRYQVHVRGR